MSLAVVGDRKVIRTQKFNINYPHGMYFLFTHLPSLLYLLLLLLSEKT